MIERKSYIGSNRFEDTCIRGASQLPIGIVLNSASYSAKTLIQVRPH